MQGSSAMSRRRKTVTIAQKYDAAASGRPADQNIKRRRSELKIPKIVKPSGGLESYVKQKLPERETTDGKKKGRKKSSKTRKESHVKTPILIQSQNQYEKSFFRKNRSR